MTTIIAVETKNGVIMGSDSQMTGGSAKTSLADGKIFRNGGYTIAVCGLARAIQAFKYADLPEITSGEDLDRFMSTTFVDSVDSIYREAGLEPGSGEILVAYKGRVFHYRADMTVLRDAQGIYTTGSGGNWARAYLTGLDKITARGVESALEVAAKNDVFSSGPFHIIELTR